MYKIHAYAFDEAFSLIVTIYMINGEVSISFFDDSYFLLSSLKTGSECSKKHFLKVFTIICHIPEWILFVYYSLQSP